MYSLSAVANIRRKAAARVISFRIAQFLVMFLNDLVKKCVEWKNQDAETRNSPEHTKIVGLYRVLAVFFRMSPVCQLRKSWLFFLKWE